LQAELEAMAKKSTWEKRAKKVQKEEHLVLGGNTNKKKHGVKKKFPFGPKEEGSGRPRKSSAERDSDGAGYRGGTGSSDRGGSGYKGGSGSSDRGGSGYKGGSGSSDRGGSGYKAGSGGSDRGGRDKPKYTISRDGDDSKSDRSRKPAGKSDGFKSDRSSRSDSKPGGYKSDRGFKSKDRPGFKSKDKPFSKFRKEESDGAFKGKGSVRKEFSKDDRKKSHSKFLEDQKFDGFEQRGQKPNDLIRINKYLSMAGVCSRREADTFIEQGLVTVNGEVITELGTKVKPTDEVKYAGERVKAESLRYLLLNKPKDCITTLSDERGRSTVMGLVKNACRERIFPVGRLDRNTTGLLLLTNDGDMAKKLTHPSHEVRKVYHVITDKNISVADLKKLESGVELDDGVAKADAALFAGDGSVRNEVGMEIHSGRNRVVRRMFSELGYEVTRLDRAAFAGLSKKGLPRGRWRFLTEKEVNYLKML